MRLPQLSTGEIYHVYNRGVDRRNIFQEKKDYERFLNGLSAFNTSSSRTNALEKMRSLQRLQPVPGDRLVNILAFCLMPNHFHLLLEQCVDDGMSKFLHKLTMSHALYFNLHYERKGALFEPKFRAKHIDDEAYYSQISKYIHLNPLDLFRNSDHKKACVSLLDYPWSSLSIYIGKKQTNFLDSRIIDDFKSPDDYLSFLFS